MAPSSEIEYDLRKQHDTLQHHGLDFNDAPVLFTGKTLSMLDDRQDYGEESIITEAYRKSCHTVTTAPLHLPRPPPTLHQRTA